MLLTVLKKSRVREWPFKPFEGKLRFESGRNGLVKTAARASHKELISPSPHAASTLGERIQKVRHRTANQMPCQHRHICDLI
jgi:hypothetical protein